MNHMFSIALGIGSAERFSRHNTDTLRIAPTHQDTDCCLLATIQLYTYTPIAAFLSFEF